MEKSKKKKLEFSPMISEFLFYEDTNDKNEKKNYLNLKIKVREQIKNNFDRGVLTEVLLDLRKDLTGQSQDVLTDLYWDLGLHNDAFEKLSSKWWQIISKGILELTTMDVVEAYGLIVKFINHRNSTIRKQAEIAVVNLKEEGIAYFLDNTKYKISEWQQLKLLDVLRHKQNFEPPQFSLWLTSHNTHVVLFALRLIKYFNQSDAEQSVITLLKHKKREIQIEAIDCIKEFYFVDAIPTLKLVYPKATMNVKIAILNAIGEIGTAKEVGFLKMVKGKEKNFIIRSKILGTLNRLCPESVMPFKDIRNENYFAALNEDGIVEDHEMDATVHTSAPGLQEVAPKDNPVQSDAIDIKAEVLSETTILENPEKSIPQPSVSSQNSEEVSIASNSTTSKPSDNVKDVETLFNLDGPLEVDQNDGQTIPTIEREIDEIDWSAHFLHESQDANLDVTEGEDERFITEPQDTITLSANFLEDAELEIMVLLEQISDLGDRRELPVLYELLNQSSSGLIAERTKELIAKFSYQAPGPNELFNTDNDITNSVFTPIFNLSDFVTKQMLLEEIKNVGDEKEIPFLKSLLDNENKRISKLAREALALILNKIDEQGLATDNSCGEKTLRAGFESKLEHHKNALHSGEGITFFDDLCSASNTLYKNSNG